MAQDEAARSTKLYVQLFETHDDIGELEKCKLQDDAHAGEVQNSTLHRWNLHHTWSSTGIERLRVIFLMINSALIRSSFSLLTFVDR